MLDYSLLSALAAVVREGSFERAARALHVSSSAVSQRIRLLEERVGQVLVVRGQPCLATDTGQRLCRHAEMVGMLEQALHDSLPALRSPDSPSPRVTLRIAVNADSLATWFVAAAAAFAAEQPALLDIGLDDQDHTAERLRSGEVLAAVTALADPVQGCRSIPLGRMRYLATASPAFVARYFPGGLSPAALAQAPCLTFNRQDDLQARWLRQVCGQAVETARHWLPASQAFVDASVAGLGWGMNPAALVAQALHDGRLVELQPGADLWVPLHWQHVRLKVPMLDHLTAAVVQAASAALPA